MFQSLVGADHFPYWSCIFHACSILMGGFLPGFFFSPLWEADAVEKEDGRGAVGETEESAAAAGSLLGVNDAAGFEILHQYKLHCPLQGPLKSPAELLSLPPRAPAENSLCQGSPFSQQSYPGPKLQNLKQCCSLAETSQTSPDRTSQGL